ncbi:hypothetical protein NKH16_06445 [Mesorhizobium sp. M1307]|uniref:hypothetical protein n=1 Tax=unclassified Mesorhizobium TaxID=325217 RepID=UPI003338F503
MPADQSSALKGEHHLMDERRGDAEEALHVAFGRCWIAIRSTKVTKAVNILRVDSGSVGSESCVQ